MENDEVRERVGRVGALLDGIEGLADPNARAMSAEVVQALLELYGEGLARMIDLAAERGGEAVVDAFAGDELVSHLLLLHGLHPRSLEVRLLGALEEVRPYLASHGGNVELVQLENGVARLRLQGSCNGCASAPATLKLAIEEAIERAAPDLEELEVDGVTQAAGPQPLIFFETDPASAVAGSADG